MCDEIINIVINKRSGDYMASIEHQPGMWGRGNSPDEAIGDLIRSHQERFCINVKEKNIKKNY